MLDHGLGSKSVASGCMAWLHEVAGTPRIGWVSCDDEVNDTPGTLLHDKEKILQIADE
jgi:hypothetical protein